MEKDEALKSIPVIFLSGNVEYASDLVSNKNRAMFTHPCDLDVLTAKIVEMTGD